MNDGSLMLEAVQKTKPTTKAIQARGKKTQTNNKPQTPKQTKRPLESMYCTLCQ